MSAERQNIREKLGKLGRPLLLVLVMLTSTQVMAQGEDQPLSVADTAAINYIEGLNAIAGERNTDSPYACPEAGTQIKNEILGVDFVVAGESIRSALLGYFDPECQGEGRGGLIKIDRFGSSILMEASEVAAVSRFPTDSEELQPTRVVLDVIFREIRQYNYGAAMVFEDHALMPTPVNTDMIGETDPEEFAWLQFANRSRDLAQELSWRAIAIYDGGRAALLENGKIVGLRIWCDNETRGGYVEGHLVCGEHSAEDFFGAEENPNYQSIYGEPPGPEPDPSAPSHELFNVLAIPVDSMSGNLGS